MSDNLSFVLQSVGKVSYENYPIPESAVFHDWSKHVSQPSLSTVRDDEVLVEVKKTGRSFFLFPSVLTFGTFSS
jgi:hypothetical protein